MEWDPQQYRTHSRMQFSIGQVALDRLQPQAQEAILDVGCGIGTLTSQIAAKTAPGSVIGIDVDPQMIGHANAELKAHPQPNLSYVQQDGVNLTFHDQFDAVFSNIMLHWVKPLQLLLDKLFGALKQGGRIQIATIHNDTEIPPKPAQDTHLLTQAQQVENRILMEFMPRGYFQGILTMEEFQAHQATVSPNLTYKIYTIPDLRAMLAKAGFKAIETDQQTYWREFDDLGVYLKYRQSNLWRFFLAYFPRQYHPQVIAKLCRLIQTDWEAIPAPNKEFPIKEKWPVVYIRAIK